MAFFRKRLAIEAAMRLMLGAAVKRRPEHALSAIAATGALSPANFETVVAELPAFEIALWHLLFLQHAGAKLGAEEITRRFTIALALALKDSGQSESAAMAHLDSLISAAMAYLNSLDSVPEEELKRNGPFLQYCRQFARTALPAPDLSNEAGRDAHFQVFHIAKQSNEAADHAFAGLLAEFRLSTD